MALSFLEFKKQKEQPSAFLAFKEGKQQPEQQLPPIGGGSSLDLGLDTNALTTPKTLAPGARVGIREATRQAPGIVTTALKGAQKLLFPTRRQLLAEIQEERQQTLAPKEAMRAVREREIEFGRVAPDIGADVDLETFFATKTVDPLFAVGAARRTVAGLTRETIRRISRSKNPLEVENILRKSDISQNEARKISSELTGAKNIKDIEKTLNQASLRTKAAQAQRGVLPERLPEPTTRVAPRRIPPERPAITKELEPLAKEARKFDTAEEFIRSAFRSDELTDIITRPSDLRFAPVQKAEIIKDSVKLPFNVEGYAMRNGDLIDIVEKTTGRPIGKGSTLLKDDAAALREAVKDATNKLKEVGEQDVKSGIENARKAPIDGFHRYWNRIPDENLTDFFNQVKKQPKELLPEKPIGKLPTEPTTQPAISLDETITQAPKQHKTLTSEGRKLVDDEGRVVFPVEMKRAPTPTEKPSFIDETRAILRQDKSVKKALEGVEKKHGNVDNIIQQLEKKGVSQTDIDQIVLEDGTRLVDAVKVKREKNGVLSAVITKQDLQDIQGNFTLDTITNKWIPTKTAVQKAREAGRTAKSAALEYYELPQLFFKRTGLSDQFYTPIREAERNAQNLKTSIFQQFEEAGLYKKGGWFTADRFNLSTKEAEEVGRYYLTRQGKDVDRTVALEDLSEQGRKFVETFDNVIKQTEDRFFKVAELSGKEPGKVFNYAPLMTNDEFKLAQEIGDMDYIFRKHPAFFSLKKRSEDVPFEMYELDYRKIAAKWIDQQANFLNLGEVTPQTKYLAQSDEFKELVGDEVFQTTNKWLQDTLNPQVLSSGEKAARFARKPAAIASLGLNLASVVKQVLTQVPLTIIEKAPPKLKSQFAKDFGINVADLPSIKERKGNAAIMDMQEGFTRAVVGPLSEFDKTNAQKSLNALLDKDYKKFLKEGKSITPEVQAQIIKMSQDRLDMWYGGMTRSQLPKAFRSELGKVLNMFIHPLTSQLNGFFYSVAKEKGFAKAGKFAEVMAAAVSIAYLEQVISNLDVEWSDTREMTADVVSSLAGNIPLISQVVFALRSDQPIQVSPAISNVWRFAEQIAKSQKDQASATDVGLAFAEMFGVPKQVRRTVQGVNTIMEGGLRDKQGKLLAPVKGTPESIRAFLRGKYGTIATQDYIRNIGEARENRRWFVPEVEFLQNGDYDRKAELFRQFDTQTQRELYAELSEGQQDKLDSKLELTVGEIDIPEIDLGEIELPEIELPTI